MIKKHVLYGFATLGTAFLAPTALSGDLTAQFDQKHKACLEQIAVDADIAYEEALIWQGDGGGRRARHCVAMALFALDHIDDALALSPDAGTKDMRADYYAEAADFWLMANMPENAYASTTAGLKLKDDHIGLRIAQARAHALEGQYDLAEKALTAALAFNPNHAAALRYRADARRHQGLLNAAKSDIEHALKYDPESVETALLRGEINEALRLKETLKIPE